MAVFHFVFGHMKDGDFNKVCIAESLLKDVKDPVQQITPPGTVFNKKSFMEMMEFLINDSSPKKLKHEWSSSLESYPCLGSKELIKKKILPMK